jgi:hypothetical protein
MTNTISNRVKSNRHFAGDLRRRLEQRHAKGSQLRDTLDSLSDAELLAVYVLNEQQGRDHVKQRTEREAE